MLPFARIAIAVDDHLQKIYIFGAVLMYIFYDHFLGHVVIVFVSAQVAIMQELQPYFPIVNILYRISYELLVFLDPH